MWSIRNKDCRFLVPETRKFHGKTDSYFFCLVPRVAVWYSLLVLLFIYVSNNYVATQSAIFPATPVGFRDVKENIIGVFPFKMHISMRYEKNNQVPVLNPDRKVSGDTMSHPSLVYASTGIIDWDLSVWI